MKLSIDTTDRHAISIILYGDDGSVITQSAIDHDVQPESALVFIAQQLEKSDRYIGDITAVEVNRGPGSFTGSRVGVAVANALSLSLQIPVNEKEVGTLEEPEY